MKCSKCHSDNPDTSRFCGSCAAALAPEGPLPPSLTKTIQTPVGFSAGTLIAGKYRILAELGRGGMGIVYKAEDVKLERPVALKFLPHQWVSDPDARERFIQEARAASALDHSNICTIHEIAETEDGRMYIAMAFYDGESLREKILRGALDFTAVVNIATQVAHGLAKAHEKGIVHRDIKPANILITKDGVAKVVDFGLAKLAGQVKLTREGTTVGTVAYMSPEQAKGEAIDRHTLAHAWYAIFLASTGKGTKEEIIYHAERARQLDPLNYSIGGAAIIAYCLIRDYGRAIFQGKENVRLHPEFPGAYLSLAGSYLYAYQFDEALAAFQQAGDLGVPPGAMEWAQYFARSGDRSKAEKYLGEYLRQSDKNLVNTYQVAGCYSLLGEKNKAFEWIEKMYEERGVGGIKVDAAFDNVRSDPRFASFMKKFGLEN